MTRTSRDLGAVEGYLVIALLALTGIAVAIATLVSMLVRIEQSHTAADMAALAAAATGSCDVGADAAHRNGAMLQRCDTTESYTVVTVTLPSGLGRLLVSAGAPQSYRASARAER